MSLFLYRRQETVIHSLDPRVKIMSLALMFLSAMVSTTAFSALAVLAGLLTLFCVTRSFYALKKMAGLLAMIGFMTFVLWVLFYQGKTPLADFGIIKIYQGAPEYAALMALKFLNMVLCGIFFLSITPLEEFSDGLILMGVPYKVAFAVSLSFRLVQVFVSTGFTIVEAQKVRGNDVGKGGIVSRIRAHAPLLIPLILNGIKKAETLTLALESKGFAPDNKIHIKGKYLIKRADITALAVMIVPAAASVAFAFYKF
jgi:energy-coupling factor transport system permease protein